MCNTSSVLKAKLLREVSERDVSKTTSKQNDRSPTNHTFLYSQSKLART